ncbi:MAG: [FeFe] hydrogenase H-cluster maturation GTPase HydF [Sphingomonadaceae bacterium]
MSDLNSTPRSERLHIAVFGRRNAGKSSLVNALTNQEVALVSEVAGTTTDPVYKAMELLPLGPVVMIDTAGIDDAGELGDLRVRRTLRVINSTDLALMVIDPAFGLGDWERGLLARLRERGIPTLLVANKCDIHDLGGRLERWALELGLPSAAVSSVTRTGIDELKKLIVDHAPTEPAEPTIVGDLIDPGDVVVLVVPIDLAMPKGRLILPQVQTIRDILDHDAMAVVVKEQGLRAALGKLGCAPRLVITDSQAFDKVAADVPPDVAMTGFSILFARYKGDLEALVAGARAVDRLRPGDKVLISEACSHHRQPVDIGKVQIPRWLRKSVGGELEFTWTSGGGFPDDLASYKLVVHCGGCMINRKEMLHRIRVAEDAGVPIVNYGVLLAKVQGVLRRALQPFPLAQRILED